MIGIVTVLYNSEKVLEDFFISLEQQTYKDFCLYIVDNASSDRSMEVAREKAGKVSFRSFFIENMKNYGVAKGNNQGIRQAIADGCEYVLLSNNDIVLDENCIDTLLEKAVKERIKVVVPKIFFYDSTLLWYAGGNFVDAKGAVAHWGYFQEDSPQYNRMCFVDYAPTCVALIDVLLFSEIGYFDEDYFVYYDDTDFMRRLKNNNVPVLYCPQAVLWHKESMSTGGMRSDFSIYYMSRNQIYYVLKYFSHFKLCIFFLYIMIHFIAKKLFQYSCKQHKILFKGYRDGLLLYSHRK